MQYASSFSEFQVLVGVATGSNRPSDEVKGCLYRFRVYPTQDMEKQYKTSQPIIFAVVVASVFLFTSLIFVAYDCLVRRRQEIVMTSAKQNNAIVAQLFPQTVRERLFERTSTHKAVTSKMRMESFLTGKAGGSLFDSAPIADLFPHCTVLFLDIAGKFRNSISSR